MESVRIDIFILKERDNQSCVTFTSTFNVRVWFLFVELISCLSFHKVLLIQAMVNAAGILSIRAEDTDLDENVKRRVSQAYFV